MTIAKQYRPCERRKHMRAVKAVLVQVAMLMALIPAIPSAEAYTHEVLYSFSGTDGANPRGGLILDAAGNVYGTTVGGGAYGSGTIFKLDATGNLTVLHSFAGGPDGASPSGLILDTTGNLYGTTGTGGAFGSGKVFKLDTSTGKETVLYSFTGGPDGLNPAGLVLDTAGNLYGTASGGGTYGSGTVFRLDATGTLTVLYSFVGGALGANPGTGVIRDPAGNLYGTTGAGGANGLGTVFELDTGGTLRVLHSFVNGDGSPSGLILDVAGNLYGATTGLSGACIFQGRLFYCGTVFKVETTTGTYTILCGFNRMDGALAHGGLFQDAAGYLYGTTALGGAYPFTNGTVFRLAGTSVSVLYKFSGGSDGANPYAGVILDALRNVYGTTTNGGAHGLGTVFKLVP